MSFQERVIQRLDILDKEIGEALGAPGFRIGNLTLQKRGFYLKLAKLLVELDDFVDSLGLREDFERWRRDRRTRTTPTGEEDE